MAELILGGIGAGVGSLIPGVGAFTGFQIGVTLGSLLFPPGGPTIDRGRVDELRVQGAQQGAAIPIVYGRNRTAGTIIWATGLRERVRTSSVGGKGGGGAATRDYTYSTSLAVLVCEGPASRVRRIWANEQVVYDWRSGASPTLASFLDPAKVRVYLGPQTMADAAIEADRGAGNVPAHKGMVYVVFEDLPLAEFGNQIPNLTFEVESAHADLAVAMADLAARAGLAPSEYDFSSLAGRPTRGMVVGARTEAGRVMEAFARANLLDIVESQGRIRAVARSGVPVLSVPADDIGAAEYGDTGSPRHVETTRSEETELPREHAVTYMAESIDFQPWTQTARRTVRWSEQQEQTDFPMSLSDAYARYLADAYLMDRWVSRARHRFTLPYRYLRLDPGDVVTIVDEGGASRVVRIVEMSMGLLAQIEVQAVDDDPIVYADPGLPPSVPTSASGSVTVAPAADLLVIETNAAVDSAADAPRIALVAGRSAPGWRGGEAQVDPRLHAHMGQAVRTLADMGPGTVFGYTTNDAHGVIGDRSAEQLEEFDTVSRVRVTFLSGVPSSCTYAEMVAEGYNLAVLGREVLQFQTAVLIAGGTYELSNFWRYRRGTDALLTLAQTTAEWGGHVPQSPFVVLSPQVRTFAYGSSQIGATHGFRLIEHGRDYSAGLPAFSGHRALTGDSRKPYGPCALRYVGDRRFGTADLALSWTRRVRVGGELSDFADAVLDEPSEAYQIEVYTDDLGLQLRVAQHTGPPPWAYTVAMQTVDGTSGGDFQFCVRQVSPAPGVGAGHPSRLKYVRLSPDTVF